jgi:predicted ribosomally synthesized peptide with SipW-like signal peptide
MELDRIEIILEKYFQGETSIAEENELKNYFSSSDVAQHLEQYQPLFGYFSQAREQKFKQEIPLQSKKRNVAWLSIAASVVVLLGIGTFAYLNDSNVSEKQDLGSYENPEIAFRETQKALALLSENVNVGIGSIQYINEYEAVKHRVFIDNCEQLNNK